MDKGKRIVILMACLLCLSLYTFLLFSNSQKKGGEVNGIEYYLIKTENGVKTYSLQNNDKNIVTVDRISTDEWLVNFNNDSYDVKGSRDNMVVTSGGKIQNANNELIKELVFGPPPIINIVQAIITLAIGIAGVYIISKAEELWYIVYKKDKEQFPKWEELTKFKVVGGIIIAIAVILLIIFIAS